MNSIACKIGASNIASCNFLRVLFGRAGNKDRGQGTLEYVGIVLAVITLTALLVGLFGGELGETVKNALSDAFAKVTGGGGGGGGGGGDNPCPGGWGCQTGG